MVGRPSARRSLAFALSCLGLLAVAPHARAYCRTMSCELGEDPLQPTCERDEHDCVVEGKPLTWPSPCLDYAIQLDGSPKTGLDGDEVAKLVEQAFLLWQSAECEGGGNPRFEARFQGFVSCAHRESVCGEASANVNTFLFYDSDWPTRPDVMGLTTPAGGVESGRLLDADIEFNTTNHEFDDASDPTSSLLFYVLAHEIGHFLGLAHSDVQGALMVDGYNRMSFSGGMLSPDDVAAICAAYPPGKPLSCAAPSLPAYDACKLPERGTEDGCKIAAGSQSSGGCSVTTAPRTASPWALLLGTAVLSWGLVRRRTTNQRSSTRRSASTR